MESFANILSVYQLSSNTQHDGRDYDVEPMMLEPAVVCTDRASNTGSADCVYPTNSLKVD
jgi:hypothetical protein